MDIVYFRNLDKINDEVASPSYTEIRLMLNTKNLANVSHILNISNVVSMLEINIFAFVSFIVHHLQRPIVSETQYFLKNGLITLTVLPSSQKNW